ncbi:MAG: sigma-70 family RNA polymerase sigma factor [Bryobacteraceae bacterium]|nr:sigma-70 family RNA polymerase sigma factor [Bryobacteraceae bacterium]
MEDSLAVALAKGGDGDAYRTLVDRYSRSVFRLAYRMTGNEQDAEDVVQETFLRAYRHLNRWDGRSSFGTWIYRIAANYALDLLRCRKRQGSVAPPEAELRAVDPGPDRLHFSGEVQRQVAATLDACSGMERTAFVLRHFEGQSIDEISAALGVSANSTKQSIFRAVQKLRRALEPLVNHA